MQPVLDRSEIARNARAELGAFVTVAGALALLGLFIAAFVSAVHLPAPDSHGVVGWITTHHYSKRQEFLTWIVALGAAVALGFGVAQLDRIRGFGAHDGLVRLWLALPSLALAATEAAWSGPPPALAFFLAALVYTAVVPVVLLLRSRVATPAPAVDAHGEPEAPRAEGTSYYASSLAIALATANGLLLGAYVPVLLGSAFGFMRFAVPLAFLLLASRFATTRESTSIAFAVGTFPLVAIVFAPALPAGPFVVALVALAALATYALTRSESPLARTGLPYAAAFAFVAVTAFVVIIANPHLLPGALIKPLDGDAVVSWMYDGLRAHVVFRDFWYPYGPIEYAQHLWSAAWLGLDRWDIPFHIVNGVVSAVCALVCARVLFGRTAFMPFVAAVLYVACLSDPRVWIPFTATVLALRALSSGRRATGAIAGALCATSLLVSPEVGAVALVAAGGIAAIWTIARRSDGDALRRAASGWAAGLGAVLACAAIVGIASDWGFAYVADVLRLTGIVDACCGQAYPSIFGGFNGAGVAPRSALEPHFAGFFLVPAILLAATLVLAQRFAVARCLTREDATLAGIAFFGALLFRSALGRSEVYHLAFVSLPAVVLALAFLERSLRSSRLRPIALGTALTLIAVLPFTTTAAAKKLNDAVRDLGNLGPALAAREYTPPDFAPVTGIGGLRLLVSPVDVADVARVRDDLRARLRPGDQVYAVPYAARYPVLLGLASPGRVGPALWGADARLEDQQRLVHELDGVRFVVYDESEWPDSDAVAWIDRYPLVAAALRDSYRPVARYGTKIVYERGTPPPPQRELATGSTEALSFLVSGWYAEESIAARAGRWTTTDASLVLAPARGDDAVALDFVAADGPAQQRTLAVTVDGRAPATFAIAAGAHRVVVPIPPGVATGRAITVGVRTSAPLDVPDARILGIFISRASTGARSALRAAAPGGETPAVAASPAAPPAAGGSAASEPVKAILAQSTPAVPLPPAVAHASWKGDVLTIVIRGRRPESIEYVQALTGTALNGANACYVNVRPPAHAAFLAKDSGTEWNDALALGKPGSQTNTSCAFDAARSAADARGTDTIVRLAITLRGKPGDMPQTWVRASDQGENWSAPIGVAPAAGGGSR